MFTPSDLYEVFRDTFLPRRGIAPALTRRSLRICRHQACMIDLTFRSVAVLAELRLGEGAEADVTRLYLDERTLERRGLAVTAPVGARYRDGRFQWHPITFVDNLATCDLGLWFSDLAGISIPLRPHLGTQTFALPSDAPEAEAPLPDPVVSAAEMRIASAMTQADVVARRAMRRHLARIAHPDLAPEIERPALDAALGRAFGAIERGRFVIEP